MIKLLTQTPEQYISKFDSGELKTVFFLSPVTSQEMQIITDQTMTVKSKKKEDIEKDDAGAGVDIQFKTSLRFRMLCLFGIKGWENGEEEFRTIKRALHGMKEKNLIAEELLDRLPNDLIVELAGKIDEMSNLTKEDEKN